MASALRFVTWLAPSIPQEFFVRVTDVVSRALEQPIELHQGQNGLSGPVLGAGDPFSVGEADFGMMCAPTFLALRRQAVPTVELLPVAPIFDDARNLGRPEYFCDIVVGPGVEGRELGDLRGLRLGYNDTASLSGYLGLKRELQARGLEVASFFKSVTQTGGHLNSIKALVAGDIDVASIDSNTRLLMSRLPWLFSDAHDRAGSSSGGAVRTLSSLGPFPVQPLAVSPLLGRRERGLMADALLQCGPWPDLAVTRFAPVDESYLLGSERPRERPFNQQVDSSSGLAFGDRTT